MNSGDRFGRLVVIQYIRAVRYDPHHTFHLWKFVCDCGSQVEYSSETVLRLIKRKGIPACPTCRSDPHYRIPEPERLDLTGQKFGKLTAIRPIGTGKNQRKVFWLIVCDCGKSVEKSGASVVNSVKKGRTPNCGGSDCKNNHLEFGEACKNALISGYRSQARSRGLDCELTDKEFTDLFKGNCHYCGIAPSARFRKKSLYGYYDFNGIDRIDNTKGYIAGNVVSSCKHCNRAKMAMAYQEFNEWLDRVTSYRARKWEV